MLPLPIRFRELRGKRHWPLFDRDGLDASQLRSLLSWHIDRCLNGDYSFKYVLSNRKTVYRVHTVGLKLAYTSFIIFVLRVISVHAWNDVWRFYFEQILRFCAWLKPPFGDPSLNPRSRASPGLPNRHLDIFVLCKSLLLKNKIDIFLKRFIRTVHDNSF